MSTLGKNISDAWKKNYAQRAKSAYDDSEEEEFDYDTTVPQKPKDDEEERFGRLKRLLGMGSKVAMK